MIGKKRSAVLLEFYVRKQKDYKDDIESINGNNEAALLKNTKINIRSSLNILEDKNMEKNEKIERENRSCWCMQLKISKFTISLLGDYQFSCRDAGFPPAFVN